jgi:hypothetical protein
MGRTRTERASRRRRAVEGMGIMARGIVGAGGEGTNARAHFPGGPDRPPKKERVQRTQQAAGFGRPG